MHDAQWGEVREILLEDLATSPTTLSAELSPECVYACSFRESTQFPDTLLIIFQIPRDN